MTSGLPNRLIWIVLLLPTESSLPTVLTPTLPGKLLFGITGQLNLLRPYIFFGESYAAASNQAVAGIYDVILGIILGFGIPEAVVAGILTTAIVKVLFKIKSY